MSVISDADSVGLLYHPRVVTARFKVMKFAFPLIFIALVLAASPLAVGQIRGGVRKTARVAPSTAPEAAPEPAAEAKEEAKEEDPAASPPEELPVRVYLVGGRLFEVDELTEGADGYWYRLGKVTALLEKARVERVERGPVKAPAASEKEGSGRWSISDASRVEDFFAAKFGRPLPVTAFGQSGLHTRWGFDHRRSLDVGLHPDSREGRALIVFLRQQGIPFIAFRYAVPGAATAPHIHIGDPSPGLRAR